MSRIAITDAQLWDGETDAPVPATVVVEGNRIAAVAPAGEPVADLPEERIDGAGMTLMPGMVEGHCHPSFTGIMAPPDLGRIGPERHMLLTAQNLRLLLEHGFTSIFEAASAKPLLGVNARDAIQEGMLAGPRMRAGSPEITTTAGLGDERQRHLHQESFGLVADGPEEMRKVARECVRDRVDQLKINLSGDDFVPFAGGEITPTNDDEVAALVGVARDFGKMVACHARSSKSVLMAVRHGIECIYHCDYANEEALDALESVKDTAFVGPAFGLVHNATREGEKYGLDRETVESLGLFRMFDLTCETYHELRRRGVRVVVGGDYGFAMTPMGQNARDIEHFVRWFGYSPADALRCATAVGAELMGMAGELGKVKQGYLADLLLVRGDPVKDVSLVQDRDNLAMIMKDGVIYKDPRLGTAAMDGYLRNVRCGDFSPLPVRFWRSDIVRPVFPTAPQRASGA